MENSAIGWTTHTFNPWIGCSKVSPGCAQCYAEHMQDHRYHRVKWGPGNPRSRTSKDYWRQPDRWNRHAAGAAVRPRVFCASLADWLDEEVPAEWLANLLCVISSTPNLDWLLLTKRPENWWKRMKLAALAYDLMPDSVLGWANGDSCPPNVWLGVSAENQKYWTQRVPLLLTIPAKVHFVSVEPMLGPLTIGHSVPDWIIAGAESGAGARPMELGWAHALADQASDRGVRLFMKQISGQGPKAITDMAQFPEGLRVREFPGPITFATPRSSPWPWRSGTAN